MREKLSPEAKVRARMDTILVCYCMTTLGLFGIALCLVFFLFGVMAPWVVTVFATSIGVAVVFGLTAVVLFLISPKLLMGLLLRSREAITLRNRQDTTNDN